MKRIIISIGLLFGLMVNLPAQKMETLYLNDGSVLNGYIKEQNIGRNIIFHSEDVTLDDSKHKKANKLYDIRWTDISFIEKDCVPDTVLTGTINEVLLKDNQKYKGFIIEIYPGDFIKIKDENDKIHVFSYSNIMTINTNPLNENQPVMEQFCFVDEIVLKNANPIKGFIVKQDIGKSISLWVGDNDVKDIPLTEIKQLRKELNNKYRPVSDMILEKGQFVYNNTEIKFQIIEPTVQDIFIIDTVNVLNAEKGKKVSIYANLIEPEIKISAVITSTVEESANLFGNKKNYYETFKMNDFISSNIKIEKSKVSKGGTTGFSFIPTESGYYVLYVSGKEGYIVFKVS